MKSCEKKNVELSDKIESKNNQEIKKEYMKVSDSPFTDCVLHNSIKYSLFFITIGVPVDEKLAPALATAECINTFGLF